MVIDHMMKSSYAYVPTDLTSTNKLVSTNQRASKRNSRIIQKVVSPEVSKLNHAVMNKKEGDQMQFSLEKRLEKRK